ncbi:Aminoglycoside phosphotransferase [Gracilaria domingensis]|nr:Aminoglycoside phosphotransferase [Gracilaria domingensis]
MSGMSPKSSDPERVVDFFSELIRLVLVIPDERKVLMMKYDDGSWDIPHYYFARMDAQNIETSVLRFQEDVSIDASAVRFFVAAELLGNHFANYPKHYSEPNRAGFSKMLLLEDKEDSQLRLTKDMAWQDCSFVQALNTSDNDSLIGVTVRVVEFLEKEILVLRSIWQPRHQLGWHKMACEWLQRVAEDDNAHVFGPVVQCRMNCMSTILRVSSDKGAYFLKSPVFGTNELQITQAISRVLPSMTLTVVGMSDELASFASREFIPLENRSEEQALQLLINCLGSLHKASLEQKERLVREGCVVLDSSALLTELRRWRDDPRGNLCALMSDFESIIPLVEARLRDLDEYDIPLTLTHGDVSISNAGLKKESETGEQTICFDWYFASISHPFFDFYLINEDISDAVRDQYLQIWIDYEPMDRLREAYDIAYPLGWLLKLRGITLAMQHRTPEENGSLDIFFDTAWAIMRNRLTARHEKNMQV